MLYILSFSYPFTPINLHIYNIAKWNGFGSLLLLVFFFLLVILFVHSFIVFHLCQRMSQYLVGGKRCADTNITPLQKSEKLDNLARCAHLSFKAKWIILFALHTTRICECFFCFICVRTAMHIPFNLNFVAAAAAAVGGVSFFCISNLTESINKKNIIF